MDSGDQRKTTKELSENGAPYWFTLFIDNHFEHLVQRVERLEERIWWLLIAVIGGLVSLVVATAARGGF